MVPGGFIPNRLARLYRVERRMTFKEEVEALMETVEDAKDLAKSAYEAIMHPSVAGPQINGCIHRLELVLDELEKWSRE